MCFADALRTNRRVTKAVAALDRSLGMIERLSECLWEPENYRMRGQVAPDEDSIPMPWPHFSVPMPLRAHNPRGRWNCAPRRAWRGSWASTPGGRRRDLLAPVYGWFTEGFDTANLKSAEALLDELT